MGPDNSDEGCRHLNRRILEIVLRDFEPFEAIVSEVSTDSGDDGFEEVRQGLQELLECGLVGAYLIHADAPYITRVDPKPDEMERYWYSITPAGKRHVQPDSELDAGVIHQ